VDYKGQPRRGQQSYQHQASNHTATLRATRRPVDNARFLLPVVTQRSERGQRFPAFCLLFHTNKEQEGYCIKRIYIQTGGQDIHRRTRTKGEEEEEERQTQAMIRNHRQRPSNASKESHLF
jgi:hypothetical protein